MRRLKSLRVLFRALGLLAAAAYLPAAVPSDWPLDVKDRKPVQVEVFRGTSLPDGTTPLIVLLSIDPDFAVPTVTSVVSGGEELEGQLDVGIEILDTLRQSVGRYFESPAVRRSESEYAHGSFRITGKACFVLPNGRYSIAVDVRDRGSSRRYADQSLTVTISDSMSHPDLFLGEYDTAGGTRRILPYNLGGNIRFGTRPVVALDVRAVESDTSAVVRLKLYRSRDLSAKDGRTDDALLDTLLRASRPDSADILEDLSAGLPCGSGTGIGSSGLQRFRCLLPVRLLRPGRYVVESELNSATSAGSARREFSVLWDAAPLSLRNRESVLAAMAYMMTSTELDHLQSAPEDSTFELFMKFWDARDPRPESPVNEALLQYFNRVDTAREKFSDIRNPNGIKTDMGKAYILYGPPASVRRLLRPDEAPTEMWDYPRLAQRLVFQDIQRRGDFLLVRIERMQNSESRQ